MKVNIHKTNNLNRLLSANLGLTSLLLRAEFKPQEADTASWVNVDGYRPAADFEASKYACGKSVTMSGVSPSYSLA